MSKQHLLHQFVAIDLGSNSFHMVIAEVQQGELKILGRLSEKVQLAAGLDHHKCLTEEAQQRGLACLARFSQRIQGIHRKNIRVVGTNALREAKNTKKFIQLAEQQLGSPVEIIAGREEARLVYLGASHFLELNQQNRLIIDIGGGSTECILGTGFEPKVLESLHMGCISYRERFFADGTITSKAFKQAVTAARRELLSVEAHYMKVGWQAVAGTSGSIRAIEQIIDSEKKGDGHITFEALTWLKDSLIDFKHTSKIDFPNLKQDRRSIFPSSVAILYAAFQQFGIKKMVYSDGALREGLLYDQLGRSKNEDVRDRTTDALMERYRADVNQAVRVHQTAVFLWERTKKAWKIDDSKYRDLLIRAGKLHEIGLAISHSQFHKHGAYLIRHSDLAGFSRQEQSALSTIVRAHRRKFPTAVFDDLPEAWRPSIPCLCIIFRIAVLLCRTRTDQPIALQSIRVNDRTIKLVFDNGWLKSKPLTDAELTNEAESLEKAGFSLVFE